MLADDWDAVRAIYEEGIRTGNATFETVVPDWEKWNRSHLPHCRLIACVGSNIVGWAALSPISAREVYRGVAEVSIYVAERLRKRHRLTAPRCSNRCVGRAWHMDFAGRNLSRECCQHRAP